MSSSIVYAGWFDWLYDRDQALVGQAYRSGSNVNEQVKCVFEGSNEEQVCSARIGWRNYKCTGVASCSVQVRGSKGSQVTWQSTCGGYDNTIMDGKDEYANFKCGNDYTETVKCVFTNATGNPQCYSDYGECTALPEVCPTCEVSEPCPPCTPVSSCKIEVTGEEATQIEWKSTCKGYAYTTIDGNDEDANFDCYTPIIETNTCVFTSSTSDQKCTNNKGGVCYAAGQECECTVGEICYPCYFNTSCEVKVSGVEGEVIHWYSSCGEDSVWTKIGGIHESVIFDCYTVPEETCFDGQHNGNELGVDCGGDCPPCNETFPSCYDGILNGEEEGIDCGGECPFACTEPEPNCNDGIQNGDEEGVDCGGECANSCPPDFRIVRRHSTSLQEIKPGNYGWTTVTCPDDTIFISGECTYIVGYISPVPTWDRYFDEIFVNVNLAEEYRITPNSHRPGENFESYSCNAYNHGHINGTHIMGIRAKSSIACLEFFDS